MDAFAKALSHALQYGVPLADLVATFRGTHFDPAGGTNDKDIPTATSLIDYVFSRLERSYSSRPASGATPYVSPSAVREPLPHARQCSTFSFKVGDCRGFLTAGEYPDGRLGEIFVNVSKEGATLSGVMDAFSKTISHGLQYGVPLAAYVETYLNTKFEPAGLTDDPDVRLTGSLVDYIFRRLAISYLPEAERRMMGLLTVTERKAELSS